jgi:hypothetical protein
MESGWQIKCMEGSRCRIYLAAGYKDAQTAFGAVVRHNPAITELVSMTAMPASLIRMFGLTGGGVKAWPSIHGIAEREVEERWRKERQR